jgi:hypothetical protein
MARLVRRDPVRRRAGELGLDGRPRERLVLAGGAVEVQRTAAGLHVVNLSVDGAA